MFRISRGILVLLACCVIAVCLFIAGKRHPAVLAESATPVRAATRPALPEAPAASVDGPVNFAKLEQFNNWASRYRDTAEKESLVTEGVALAKARRPEFLKLIKTDSARALKEAVPMVVRQDLPPKVVAQLEERVRGVGQLRTYAGTPLAGQPAVESIHYLELKDGPTYEAHTSGREKDQLALKNNRSVNGVAITPDKGIAQLALDPNAVRPLEVGERPDPSLNRTFICPISGNSTAIPPDQASAPVTSDEPVVEAQGTIVYLCNGSHVTVYEDQLESQEVMGEGAGGGGQPYNPTQSYVGSNKAYGVLKALYIPVTFPDENVAPTTEANAYNTMKDVSDYYNKSSFGKLSIATTVTPLVMMPHDGKWYQANDSANGGTIDCLGLTHNDARAAAKAMGYDPANYGVIIVLQSYAYGISRGAGGWGSVGGTSVWIYSSTWREVVAHEMGHTFGLAHANYWDTGGLSAVGNGANQEYGDIYDIMGGGDITAGQYNIAAKEQIGWLTSDNMTTVAESGTYRITAHDANILDPTRRYGLKVVKNPTYTYYAEVRQLHDADSAEPWLAKGVQLEWKSASGSAANCELIDTTPGSINGKQDGNIVLGRTFSDFDSGIHITPIAVNSGTQKSVDVVVNLGQFPTNQAPTLTLNSSATNVPVGATVTFNAVASDPDGDALAYYWSYGNGDKTVLGNTPSISRTFSTAGQYWVGCTVSDMKGKTAVRYAVINVGAVTTFSIGGRVTNGGTGMPNIPVFCTGKETITDSDGYYTITGLAAGSYTPSPALNGYTFTTSLPSPIVNVGPNIANANFTTAAGTLVSVVATVSSCVEDVSGTPGKFTITRTGSTAAALTVNYTVTGTATSGTDYTSIGTSAVIPAGSSSVVVNVVPKSDTAKEGPETVRLLLSSSASYVVSGPVEAVVTIQDSDDGGLPKVGIIANEPVTIENSGVPAQFTVSRTGATTAALTVNYTVTGTATAGARYTSLGTSVVIPAGQSSVVVPVNTINDSVSQSNQTVIITVVPVTPTATYILDTTQTAATATIVDDDQQVITVVASDPIATEGASPPDYGTFLITRTGDTSQALTVFYSLAGSALQGVDYAILPGTVIIPAGSTSAAVTIVPLDDGQTEDDQTVTLLLGSLGTNYKLGDINTSTLTIKSNPANLPFISVAGATSSLNESSGSTTAFNFAVSGVMTSSVVVNYTVSGTATPGVDYTALSGSVTIPAGSGNRIISIPVAPIQDTALEDLESITVTLTPSSSYITWPASSQATIWLYDDDQPTVFVDASSTVPTEAGTASSFYISRTVAGTTDLTVNYTMSGTATNGTDYAALSGTAVIPANALGVSVVVTSLSDAAAEGTETIIMSVAPGAYSRSPLPAILYLTDSQTSTTKVGFVTAAGTTTESVGTFNIPVTLSAASATPVTVDYLVGSGSLTASASTSSGFSAPYWVRMVRTGINVSAYRSADGTTWTQQGTTQTVGMGTSAFVGLCLGANNSSASQVTALFDNVTVTSGSGAFSGSDIGFTPNPGTWSLASGTYSLTAQTNDISGSSDSCYLLSQPVSGDCTITARVTAISGGTVSTTKAGVMIRESLTDYARQATCALMKSSGTTFIWRSGAVTNAAGSGVDFTLPRGTLTFPPGTTTLNIPVSITDDAVVENTEELVVALANPGNAALGTISQYILGISDNDAPPSQPVVGFAAASASAPEAVATASIYVTLSSTATAPVTVNYAVTGGTAVSGTDYNLASGTLTFAAGETAKLLPCTIIDNAIAEANKTIVIGLSGPSGCTLGAASSFTYTIVNDDTPTVTIVATDAIATEGPTSTDTGTFTISRTGATASALTVNFTVSGTATSGTDYTALGTSVVIPAGSSGATLTVSTIDDTASESAETVIVTLASNSAYTLGSPSAATVTINDDDKPTVSIVATTPTASETGPTPGVFTVSRTGSLAAALTVNFTVSGSATSGTDYTSIGTSVTIPINASSKTITLTPIDDVISEGDEYALVTLSTSSSYNLGAAYFASITISDNDFAPFVQITSPSVPAVILDPGTGLVLTAVASDDGTPSPLVTTWSKTSGPGTVTFGSVNALTTTATFSSSGVYVLKITAYDGNQSTVASVTVNVGGTEIMLGKDIGNPTVAGSNTGSAGTYTVTSTGNNENDDCRYLSEPVSGDFTVTARLAGFTGGQYYSWSGLEVRESLTVGAPLMAIYNAKGGEGYFNIRTTQNGSVSGTNTSTPPGPWMRITRVGNVFHFYRSTDGTTWVEWGTGSTNAMSSSVYVGLTAAGRNSGGSVTMSYDNFSVTPALNKGANVNAGTDQIVASSANLAATVTDDAQPLATPTLAWSQVSGPGTTTFGIPTAASTTATFSTTGTYVLRLIANDGWEQTFDDVTVTSQPTVTVAATDAAAAETGLDSGTFTFTRTGSTASALTVAYTIGGTATNGTDYSSISNSVVIPAGSASATVTVTPIADNLVEGDETTILTVSADPSYVVGAPSAATVTIADAPVVSLSTPVAAANETGLVPGKFTVTRSGSTTAALVVKLSVGGTATPGSDYATIASTVTIPSGSASADIAVTPLADATVEGDETVTLTVTSDAAYALGSPVTGTVTIADQPVVTLATPIPTANETGLVAGKFTVSRSGPTTAALVVKLAMTGTASNGTDYAAIGSTVTIPIGAASADVTVTPLADSLVEGSETAIATITADAAYTIGSPSTGTVTIADQPVVTVSAAIPTANETGLVAGKFTVTRSGATTAALAVKLTLSGTATNGTDYSTIGTTVTIPIGSSSADIAVTPLADTLSEGSETVIATITSDSAYAVGTPSAATVTILDQPVVTIAASVPNADETGLVPGKFTVTRTGTTTAPLTVTLALSGTATNGTDYATIAPTVTIPSGSASVDVIVTPLADNLVEGSETVIATISSNPAYATGSPSAATVTIADQPVVTLVATVSTASETGLVPGKFTISRSGPNTAALSVNLSLSGTATNGTDYATIASTVTIPVGSSSADVMVTPLADSLDEGSETVIATLSTAPAYAIGGSSSATVTILDQPVVTLSVPVANSHETGLVPGKFTLTRTGPLTGSLTVNFTVTGSATPGSDYAAIGSSVVIPSGAASADVTISPFADAVAEGDETVVLTVDPATAYALGASTTGTVTISDQPVVTVSTPMPDAHETGLVAGKFTVTRTGPTTDPLTVNFTTGGTATGGVDYAAVGSSVVIPAGAASADIAITPVGDNLVEGDETVIITLAADPAYAIGATSTGTVTIADQPVLTVSVPTPNASEVGLVPGKFTIARSGSTTAALVANVTITGTATNGVDYTTIGTSVTIPAGAASADVIVTPLADSLVEGDETVILTLAPDAAYAIAAASSGTVIITDQPAGISMDNWRTAKFGAQAGDPAVSGDNADPDHDGVPNLLEYALGTEPLDGVTKMPALAPATTPMALHLDLPDPAPADIIYTVEGIDALGGSWTPLARKTGTGAWTWLADGDPHLTPGPSAGGRSTVNVAVPDSMATASRYFLRLRASRN